MDSVDIEVLRAAEEWQRSGRRVVLGTIVKTWGSAPRPVGAMVAIRDHGQIVGSVSGGCVEDDLVDKVREKFAAANFSFTFSTRSSSTQPPETEPTIWPSSRIATMAPIGRGAEPQVFTIVPSAAR